MKSTSVGAKPQARESQRGVRGSQFFSPFRARETSKDKGKDRPGSDAEGAHSDSRQTSAPSADDSALADSSTAWGISTSVSLPSASGSRGPPTYFRSPSNGFIQVISATGDSTGASTPEMRSSPPATPSRSRDGPPRSGSVTPSGHFGSFHTSNRSLTLQALSAAHTTPLGVRNRSGVASPGSGPCVPGEYPDRQTEDDGAVSSSRRPSVLEEGMGIALGSDADAAERNIGESLR